ncbi:helix-turn-helix domain-containing protein [Spirosoma koreense]
MSQLQSLEDFYQSKFNWMPDNLRQDIGHFNVFRLEDSIGPHPYIRRDFYKISLIRGRNIIHYADKSIEISGTTLIFFSPQVPYTWESLSTDKTGFFCIFKEAFFSEFMRGNTHDLPMFRPGGKPSYVLTDRQDEQVSALFQKMIDEIRSDYRYKYDLLRNYVSELIHYALKLQPSETLYQHTDANSRITAVFVELLERQFPIESPSQRFQMRSPKEFADHLAVHVNHLNRALKSTTGKTTTEYISERLITEATALLKHTNWNVSEISYSLGFDEPAHFNNFFKRQTHQTPSSIRTV